MILGLLSALGMSNCKHAKTDMTVAHVLLP